MVPTVRHERLAGDGHALLSYRYRVTTPLVARYESVDRLRQRMP